MAKRKYKLVAVSPAFHRKLKSEAAKAGVQMIPYTEKLSQDCQTLSEMWKEKKKERTKFKIGL